MPLMDRQVEARMAPGWQPPVPIAWDPGSVQAACEQIKTFTDPAVLAAGLIDEALAKPLAVPGFKRAQRGVLQEPQIFEISFRVLLS